MIRQAEEKDLKIIMQRQKTDIAALTFVFVDKHQIKGFVSLADNNHIHVCCAGKDVQQQKTAQKLIRYLQKRRPTLRLSVAAQKHQKVDFYHRLGFKIVQEYTHPEINETQLLMCWSLGCPPNRLIRIKGDS